MNSAIARVGIAKKPKTVIKGIIRKGKRKNIVMIIGDNKYFVTISALKNVVDGIEETTPIFGY